MKRILVAAVLPAVAAALAGCESTPPRHAPQPIPAVVVPAAATNGVATPGPAPVAPPPAPAAPPAERYFHNVKIKVTGLTCPYSCVRDVRSQLSAVEGVLDVVIDFDASTALVSVKPGTDPASVVAGLKAPYGGRVVSVE